MIVRTCVAPNGWLATVVPTVIRPRLAKVRNAIAIEPLGTRGGWIWRSMLSRDGRRMVPSPTATTTSSPTPSRSNDVQPSHSPSTSAATPASSAANPVAVMSGS